jgi:hypothetical protein
MSRMATATVEEEVADERTEQHYEEIEKLQEMVTTRAHGMTYAHTLALVSSCLCIGA